MAKTHTVKTGDTLSKIAEKHGTTVARLMILNPQIKNKDLVYIGQLINLPESKRQNLAKLCIDEAKKHIGNKSGQCKIFVQDTVRAATGIAIPLNHPHDKWRWSGVEYLGGQITGKRLRKDVELKEGDILQILWYKELVKQKYPFHTCFVLKADEANITLLDSNFLGDEIVREHSISKDWFFTKLERGTVYKIHSEPLA